MAVSVKEVRQEIFFAIDNGLKNGIFTFNLNPVINEDEIKEIYEPLGWVVKFYYFEGTFTFGVP